MYEVMALDPKGKETKFYYRNEIKAEIEADKLADKGYQVYLIRQIIRIYRGVPVGDKRYTFSLERRSDTIDDDIYLLPKQFKVVNRFDRKHLSAKIYDKNDEPMGVMPTTADFNAVPKLQGLSDNNSNTIIRLEKAE